MSRASPITAADQGVHVRVKAVPGASRDEVAGVLGEALKVRVAAPPEAGKANKAIRRLVADAFEVDPRDVLLVAGEASPRKTLLIRGLDVADATRRLSALRGSAP